MQILFQPQIKNYLNLCTTSIYYNLVLNQTRKNHHQNMDQEYLKKFQLILFFVFFFLYKFTLEKS